MEKLEFGLLKQVTVMLDVKYVASQCPFCRASLIIHMGVGNTISGCRSTITSQEITPQSDFFVSHAIAKEDMQNAQIFKSCVGCAAGIGKLVDFVFSGGFMERNPMIQGEPDEVLKRLKGL